MCGIKNDIKYVQFNNLLFVRSNSHLALKKIIVPSFSLETFKVYTAKDDFSTADKQSIVRNTPVEEVAFNLNLISGENSLLVLLESAPDVKMLKVIANGEDIEELIVDHEMVP